jgi:hypothetical protein
MLEFIKGIGNLGIGAGAIFLFLSIFIEWTPLKLNPIGWLGKRFNKHIEDKVDVIQSELVAHMANEYRTRILKFQNECIRRRKHTKEEFDSVLRVCTKYEALIRKYKLENGECEMAMEYIRRVYNHCLDDGDFVNLANAPLTPLDDEVMLCRGD